MDLKMNVPFPVKYNIQRSRHKVSSYPFTAYCSREPKCCGYWQALDSSLLAILADVPQTSLSCLLSKTRPTADFLRNSLWRLPGAFLSIVDNSWRAQGRRKWVKDLFMAVDLCQKICRLRKISFLHCSLSMLNKNQHRCKLAQQFPKSSFTYLEYLWQKQTDWHQNAESVF